MVHRRDEKIIVNYFDRRCPEWLPIRNYKKIMILVQIIIFIEIDFRCGRIFFLYILMII